MGEDLFDLSAVDSQQLLDALGDAVVVADHKARIVYVNASAEQLLGWEKAALLGRPVTVLMPERMRSLHDDGLPCTRRRASPASSIGDRCGCPPCGPTAWRSS